MRFKVVLLMLLIVLPFAVPPAYAQPDDACTPETVLDWVIPARTTFNNYVAELDSDNGWSYSDAILAGQSLRRQLEDSTPPDCALPIKYNFIVSYTNLTDFLMFALTDQETLGHEISVKRMQALGIVYDDLIAELSATLDFDLREAYIKAEEATQDKE